jgi:hypothetical protein
MLILQLIFTAVNVVRVHIVPFRPDYVVNMCFERTFFIFTSQEPVADPAGQSKLIIEKYDHPKPSKDRFCQKAQIHNTA